MHGVGLGLSRMLDDTAMPVSSRARLSEITIPITTLMWRKTSGEATVSMAYSAGTGLGFPLSSSATMMKVAAVTFSMLL